jgi:hypothetical protein
MTKLERIKEEIESLPTRDFSRLSQWMAEKDWEKWDREIKRDSKAGKLDFLIEEARAEKKGGKLEDLGHA